MVSQSQLRSRSLSTSLQQRTQQQAQQEAIRKQQEAQQKAQQEAQQETDRINAELEKFKTNLTYDNYEIEYNKLSPEIKARVQSPSELKKTKEYQDYQKSKEPTTTQRAYDQILRAAQGKRTLVSSDIAGEYERLLTENPELRRAVESGQVAGLRARELGFGSAQEFSAVSSAILKPEIKVEVTGQSRVATPRNTYDVSTKTYYDSCGQATSTITPPKSATIIDSSTGGTLTSSGWQSVVPTQTNVFQMSSQQPIFSSQPLISNPDMPTQLNLPIIQQSSIRNQFYSDIQESTRQQQQEKKDFIQSETKRYQDLGYSQYQSGKLAQKSYESGGMSLVPGYTRYTQPVKEFIDKSIIFTKKVLESKPVGYLMDKPINAGIGGANIAGYNILPPIVDLNKEKVTYGGTLPYLIEGVDYIAEKAGEARTAQLQVAEEVGKENPFFGKVFTYQPLSGEFGPLGGFRPSKEVEEERREKLEPFFKEGSPILSFLAPTTPEEYGQKTKAAVSLGAYAIPYFGTGLLVSGAARGIDEVRNPEKEADKIFKQYVRDYNLSYEEQLKNLPEGYEIEPRLTTEELKAEVYPGIIEQVERRGTGEFLGSSLFLGLGGAGKIYSEFAPRAKLGGLSKYQYTKRASILEKVTPEFGDQPVKWLSVVEKEGGKVDLIGQQGLRFDSTGKIYSDKFVGPTPRDTSVLTRDITVSGFIKASEAGKKFIPEATGKAITTGTILIPKKTPFKFLGEEVFKTGTETLKTKFVKQIGDINVFKFGAKSGVVPGASTSAIYKESLLFFRPRSVRRLLKKGVQTGGTPIKEYTSGEIFKFTPTQTEEMFGKAFQESYLVTSPKSAGVTLVKASKSGEGVNVIKPFGGRKTPLSTTFPEIPKPKFNAFDIQAKSGVPDLKSITKPKITSDLIVPPAIPSPSINLPSVSSTNINPFTITGGAISESIYAGTGQYERTEDLGMISPKEVQPIISEVKIENLGINVPKVTFIQPSKIRQEISSPLINPQRIEQQVLQVQKQIPKQIFVPSTKPIERQIFSPIQRTQQKTQQKQQTRQVSQFGRPFISPRIQLPINSITPKIRVPLSRISSSLIKSPVQPVKSSSPYTFQYKRRGKILTSPFAFRTEKEAEEAGKLFALKSAVASIKPIKAKSGQRVVNNPFKLNPQTNILFRKGKGGFLVQREKLRIISPGEKAETSYVGAKVRRTTKSKRTKSKKKRR